MVRLAERADDSLRKTVAPKLPRLDGSVQQFTGPQAATWPAAETAPHGARMALSRSR